MTEFVGQRAALPHRIPGACDTNEYGVTSGIPHRQAVLIRTGIEYRNVDPGGLFNDRNEVAQRLHTQVMVPAEPRSSGSPLGLSVHGPPFASDRGRYGVVVQIVVQFQEVQ